MELDPGRGEAVFRFQQVVGDLADHPISIAAAGHRGPRAFHIRDDLQAEGVEGLCLDRDRLGHPGPQALVDPLLDLRRGVGVECHDEDLFGRNQLPQQRIPHLPHNGRRLPRPGGGHQQVAVLHDH